MALVRNMLVENAYLVLRTSSNSIAGAHDLTKLLECLKEVDANPTV